ncbi:MAG: hypothetical protein WD066_13965 [Planctomycetaceae bacterium]
MRHDDGNFARSAPPKIGFAGDPRALETALIPAFARTPAVLRYVACANVRTAIRLGRRFRFPEATTRFDRLLDDPELTAIVIARDGDETTNHVRAALSAGKRVLSDAVSWLDFESPPGELSCPRFDATIAAALERGRLAAGFHRRHAPLIVRARELLAESNERRTMELVVRGGTEANAASHGVDLLAYLCPRPIAAIERRAKMGHVAVTLRFVDGSRGSVRFEPVSAGGFRERLTVVVGDRSIAVTDFRRLRGVGFDGACRKTLWRADDGRVEMARRFVESSADLTIPSRRLRAVRSR